MGLRRRARNRDRNRRRRKSTRRPGPCVASSGAAIPANVGSHKRAFDPYPLVRNYEDRAGMARSIRVQLVNDDFDFAAFEAAPEYAKVQPASNFVDEVIASLTAGHTEAAGAYSPWRKVDNVLRFRNGEVTVWAGINGHGKSLIASQVALFLQRQKQRVLIASFEMRPVATLR